jgi:PAS domain S-box-containing protein
MRLDRLHEAKGMSLDWSALQILDAMPDIVYLKDPSGRNVFVNKAYCDLLSLPKESLLGKTDAELLPQSLAEKCRESDALAIRTGAPVRVEEQDIANGHERFFETIKNPIMRDGKLIGILGISRDITHHKVVETRLAESEDMYRRLVEERTAQLRERERLAAIGETAAMVGHDLRNPLQVLANVFYMNEMEAKRAPKEFQGVAESMGLPKANDTIRRQIAYMEKIVLDLQDFAREMVPRPIPADLIQIIADSFPLALPPNVKVITNFGAKTVFADDYMIRRAISNLISNAIQAMPLGGTMTINTCKKGDSIAIGVSDTGCGMDERAMANLFKPLCTTKAKGMGMGLVVVKKMVELQGGSVNVESEVGKGTTFAIMLPDKTP